MEVFRAIGAGNDEVVDVRGLLRDSLSARYSITEYIKHSCLLKKIGKLRDSHITLYDKYDKRIAKLC